MRTRKIGTTNIEASVVALGAWAIGGGPWWGTTDETKIREKVMDKAGDSGLGKADLSNFYTSPVAGAGNI